MKQLIFCKIGPKIAFVLLEKFLNSLGYRIKDTIVWLFEIKDLIS